MDKLNMLRGQYKKIVFKSFTYSVSDSSLDLELSYDMSPELDFVHKLSVDFADLTFKVPSPKLVFLLGM